MRLRRAAEEARELPQSAWASRRRISSSASTSSARAAKLGAIRWRITGRARARTSSMDGATRPSRSARARTARARAWLARGPAPKPAAGRGRAPRTASWRGRPEPASRWPRPPVPDAPIGDQALPLVQHLAIASSRYDRIRQPHRHSSIPSLRSLVGLHVDLPAGSSIQLRFRQGR